MDAEWGSPREPQPEWFSHPSELHGVAHTRRVMANVEEILAHSCDDSEARAATDDAEALTALWILKDADGLDRARLGDLDLRQHRYTCSVEIARGTAAAKDDASSR